MEHFKLAFEEEAVREGAVHVVGIDEVGRGPLAGPVMAACVQLVKPGKELLDDLNDSKKLSPAARERLLPQIRASSIYGVGSADNTVINAIGIEQALRLAVYDAYMGWRRQQATEGKVVVLLDGDRDFLSEMLPTGQAPVVETIIRGDSLAASIMAASVLAKETRDTLMRSYDVEYPVYGFGGNSGYGTKAHIEALRANGPCPIHRKWWEKAVKSGAQND